MTSQFFRQNNPPQDTRTVMTDFGQKVFLSFKSFSVIAAGTTGVLSGFFI